MKRDTLSTVALALAAFVMFGMGVVGLFAPQQLLNPLGIALTGAASFNEARSAYGGLHLALAGFYAWGAFKPAGQGAGLGLLVAQMAGLVGVRAASLVIDGMPDAFVFKPMTAETVLLVLGAVALLRRRAAPTP